jgi:hypothetical protein
MFLSGFLSAQLILERIYLPFIAANYHFPVISRDICMGEE